MVKINLSNGIESWYVREIKKLFGSKKTSYPYSSLDSVIQRELGILLDELIVLRPDDLKLVATWIKTKYPSGFLETDPDRVMFEGAYKVFRRSQRSKKFIEKTALKVCPYCNRNYIHNFKRRSSQEATAQLDHFYDKSKNPYLALCMYNLVPCCSTCNLRKSGKDIVANPIFNPYDDNLDSHAKFSSLDILSLDDIKDQELSFFAEERMNLKLSSTTPDSRINRHIKAFNIKELYDQHKDIVAELYQKKVIYSDEYIKELLDSFEGKVFSDRDELLKLITCTSIKKDEINKRPLSKLTRDILIELGLI